MHTLSVLTISTILAFVPTMTIADRIEHEMKCLDTPITKQCNLELTCPGWKRPLTCQETLTEKQNEDIQSVPIIRLKDPHKLQLPARVVVLMYDVDAPIDPQDDADGWVHWLATAVVNATGFVHETAHVKGKEYFGPSPPPGPAHRYQMMVFPSVKDVDQITVKPGRVDQLCVIVEENSLGQPLAATQFTFGRTEE